MCTKKRISLKSGEAYQQVQDLHESMSVYDDVGDFRNLQDYLVVYNSFCMFTNTDSVETP